MTDIDPPVRDNDQTGHYTICVRGRIDTLWSAWFDGLTITTEDDGTTVIHGPVADQAALFGLLHKMRDVGLPLVSVVRVDPADPYGPPIDPR
jgi:hypothetical protein